MTSGEEPLRLPGEASLPVRYDSADGVAVVTLNRPERGNAWTGRMEAEYRRALTRAETDPDVAVVIITGAGRHFCVGADTRALDRISGTGVYDDGVRAPLAQPAPHPDPDLGGRHSFLWAMSKPVIAAVNGAAAGIGFVIACYADLRFATEGAKFTTATARLGLPVEFGLSWLLPRLVGIGRAAELTFGSPVISAEEAERMGLVNLVIPGESLLPETLDYARRMARECAPSSLRAAKAQLYTDLRGTLAASEADYFRRLDEMTGGPDFAEGVAALVGRRAPNFRAIDPARPT